MARLSRLAATRLPPPYRWTGEPQRLERVSVIVWDGARPRPSRARWRWGRALFLAGVWGGLALVLFVLVCAWDLPRPESALAEGRRPSLTIEDRAGGTIATFGDVVGETMRLADLPPYVPEAAVAIEDRHFWSHPGIDLLGIGRALMVDARAGRVRQGGSTITQQVAKNLFLTNARTLRRKVQEVLLTFWLERHFSKREILEIWLNRVYLGSGVWGVDAAARLYFGVSARQLTLGQAAVIAGLPRAPSRLNPRTDPAAAAARGREVLAAMVGTGAITADRAREAGETIGFAERAPSSGAWFGDWIADQADAVVPPNADAVIRATLDPATQRAAETALASVPAEIGEGAVVVLDSRDGAVRALVGGRDYHRSPYDRAVLARRQPGSAFKPFVWLAALEAGVVPDDMIEDAPIRLGTWSPVNFDRRFRGPVTVEDGLAESLNTVAVRLMLRAGGPKAVTDMARRLGIRETLPNDASVALGTGEVRPIDLTTAYAAFCNGGARVAPYGIETATVMGRAVAPSRIAPRRVLDEAEAASMTRMLTAVVTRGTGRAAAMPGKVVFGKTGTTQDNRDAWFVGCADTLAIGVWLGNDDDSPMRDVTGGGWPARVFHDIAASSHG